VIPEQCEPSCLSFDMSFSVSSGGSITGTSYGVAINCGPDMAGSDPRCGSSCAQPCSYAGFSVSAVPASGYVFDGWQCTGVGFSTASTAAISGSVDDSCAGHCTAQFKVDDSKCTVSYTAVDPKGFGRVNGQVSGTLNDCSASLSATSTGSQFSMWTANNPCNWTVSENGASISVSDPLPGDNCNNITVSAFFTGGPPTDDAFCYIPLKLVCDGTVLYHELESQDGTVRAFGASSVFLEYTSNPALYKQNHNYSNCSVAARPRPPDPVVRLFIEMNIPNKNDSD